MIRAAVLTLALLLTAAAPAAAAPLLDPGDAAELAQELADATDEQGVCYGWRVYVSDASGGSSGFEVGSSAGPGTPIGANVGCTKRVELTGDVTYTCGSCESEDSSSMSVTSSFPRGPTKGDLEDLGLNGGDLKNDDGDTVLASMVGALPLITGSKGGAPALAAAPNRAPIPATDKAQNSPSLPDWLRESWLALTVFLVLGLGGATWLLVTIRRERAERRSATVAPETPTPTAE